MSAWLDARMGDEVRCLHLPDDRIFRIGRSDKNNVVLDDDLASRNHAMLQRAESGEFYLTDLGSSNGTLVNGARISVPVILRAGDLFTIGTHEFIFQQPAVTEPRPPMQEPEGLKATNVFFAEKLISVLVVDIRDFTGLAQRLDAARLSQITGAFFREAGGVLQTRGAWGQKYIGDAIMAVWVHKKRAPELSELNAIFSSLEQLAKIAGRLQGQLSLAEPIQVGAAVNTGAASIGNVGSISTSDYTALGDVVNKAFRLEAATRHVASCDVLLGQATYDFLTMVVDASGLFRQETVELKGYNEPAKAYGAPFAILPGLVENLARIETMSG
jgi:adenylate cyclase